MAKERAGTGRWPGEDSGNCANGASSGIVDLKTEGYLYSGWNVLNPWNGTYTIGLLAGASSPKACSLAVTIDKLPESLKPLFEGTLPQSKCDTNCSAAPHNAGALSASGTVCCTAIIPRPGAGASRQAQPGAASCVKPP